MRESLPPRSRGSRETSSSSTSPSFLISFNKRAGVCEKSPRIWGERAESVDIVNTLLSPWENGLSRTIADYPGLSRTIPDERYCQSRAACSDIDR